MSSKKSSRTPDSRPVPPFDTPSATRTARRRPVTSGKPQTAAAGTAMTPSAAGAAPTASRAVRPRKSTPVRPQAPRRQARPASAPVPAQASAVAPVPAAVVVSAPPPAAQVTSARKSVAEVSHDDIRLRAYFLSMERGGQGSDVEFWLEAERQLREAGEAGTESLRG